jgi:hypothetical protein
MLKTSLKTYVKVIVSELNSGLILRLILNPNTMAIFSSILRRKLSDNQMANVFLNGLLDVVDTGFSLVVELINEDIAFVKSPGLEESANNEFALIVLVTNISLMESSFESDQAGRIERLVFDKLGKMYNLSDQEFEKLVRTYQKFIARTNHPSKNIIYGMSKAVFHKYNLNDSQDDYFRRMEMPNPLFLKRMDEVMQNFIWDWDSFFKKYKLN